MADFYSESIHRDNIALISMIRLKNKTGMDRMMELDEAINDKSNKHTNSFKDVCDAFEYFTKEYSLIDQDKMTLSFRVILLQTIHDNLQKNFLSGCQTLLPSRLRQIHESDESCKMYENVVALECNCAHRATMKATEFGFTGGDITMELIELRKKGELSLYMASIMARKLIVKAASSLGYDVADIFSYSKFIEDLKTECCDTLGLIMS